MKKIKWLCENCGFEVNYKDLPVSTFVALDYDVDGKEICPNCKSNLVYHKNDFKKTKTYRFEAQSLVRGDIEANNEDEARRIFIEDLEQGELDEELRANVVVSNVGEVKNDN